MEYRRKCTKISFNSKTKNKKPSVHNDENRIHRKMDTYAQRQQQKWMKKMKKNIDENQHQNINTCDDYLIEIMFIRQEYTLNVSK